MNNLKNDKLLPLKKDSERVSKKEIDNFLSENPDWQVKIPTDKTFLIDQDVVFRKYKFNDFEEAVRFSRQVADLANQVNHHPTLIVDWGALTVIWTTHSIHGLGMNDLIMAKNTDILFEGSKTN